MVQLASICQWPFCPVYMIAMFKEAPSPAATGNPEKYLLGGNMRSHWVKQLLCSHCDSHQKGRTLQGEALHVEVTHVFVMPSTIAWFSTVWGISKCLRQFSDPKTSRVNRDWKKRRRKNTPTYLHFSVVLTRAGDIFKTPFAEMNTLSPYSVSKSSCIVPIMMQPLLCKSQQQLWTAQSAVDQCLPPIQLQIGLNH